MRRHRRTPAEPVPPAVRPSESAPRRRRGRAVATAVVLVGALTAAAPAGTPDSTSPASQQPGGGGHSEGKTEGKKAVATGHGGAVSSVDEDATAAGIEVLRKGGNAADAAVATAAALGVTEPYSAGVGGGGYFVHYSAKTGRVSTLDGRETAPASADEKLLQEDGEPLDFDDAVTSGLSVGTPGTPATWQDALHRWGNKGLGQVLRPAEKLAQDGFTVDKTFRDQTAENEDRFRDFPATAALYLPDGKLPKVGSTLRNPDLADTYRQLGEQGTDALYRGPIGDDLVRSVRTPPVDEDADRTVRPGDLTRDDLAGYRTVERKPTKSTYRGHDIYGMAPSSSGGIAVGEALNVLEHSDLSKASQRAYLHRYLEASRIAFADRGRWVADPEQTDVPTKELLDKRFADSRACLIDDDKALTSPLAPGDPRDPEPCGSVGKGAETTYEGENTTHLTVADRWGDVVSYTLTIEQTGGSGITVPGRGFLLNNELTDFSFAQEDPAVPDPNLPGSSKRPRSSISPTLVLDDDRPVLALGSPGGATIVTTVLQTLTNHLDRGMSLPDALAAPRASQRNAEETEAEAGFGADGVRGQLEALGHQFTDSEEIGAATGVQLLPHGGLRAVAEPERRGGGSAMVVHKGGHGKH